MGDLTRLDPRSVRVIHATPSAILAAVAVVDEVIARNPCRSGAIKLPKPDASRAKPWAAGGDGGDGGDGSFVRCGLAVEYVDFLRGVVHVRRQLMIVGSKQVFGSVKNGKVRDVPLPESVAHALAAHLAACPAVTVELPWERLSP